MQHAACEQRRAPVTVTRHLVTIHFRPLFFCSVAKHCGPYNATLFFLLQFLQS